MDKVDVSCDTARLYTGVCSCAGCRYCQWEHETLEYFRKAGRASCDLFPTRMDALDLLASVINYGVI